MKKLLVTSCLIFLYIQVFTQNKFSNAIENFNSKNKWHYVKQDLNLSSNDLVSSFSQEYKLSPSFSIKEHRFLPDSIIGDKREYLQYYHNIPVEDGWISCFEKKGKARVINGEIIRLNNKITKNYINEKEALAVALAYVNAEKYIWEDSIFEIELKKISNDPYATNFPEGKLLFAKIKEDAPKNNENYTLAWSFDITSLVPFTHSVIYVNAYKGEFLK